jgi:hypothetical protein
LRQVRYRPSWFSILLLPALVIVGLILSRWVGLGMTLFIWLFVFAFIGVATWGTLKR